MASGKPGLVLAEINLFGVGAVVGDAKLNAEKTAACGSCHIHVNHAVAHFKVFQDRRSAIEQEALAALILSRLGLPFKFPARRIGGNGERLRGLRISRRRREKQKRTNCRTSKHM